MSPDQIKRILEAAILSSAEPLSIDRLAALFSDDERPTNAELRALLESMVNEYETRGICLQKVASGYRFQVQSDITHRLTAWLDTKPVRYSRALLETLALIAYRQPVTRAEIEDIRGVAISTGIMRTLLEREWIHVVGHRDVPGKPALYATTTQFLNDLNLRSLSELPALLELQDEPATEQLTLELETPAEGAEAAEPEASTEQTEGTETEGSEPEASAEQADTEITSNEEIANHETPDIQSEESEQTELETEEESSETADESAEIEQLV